MSGDPFSEKDFDHESYVKEKTSQCVGANELLNQRTKLQAQYDQTQAALKKNVFQHYEQFIETSKDISYLAGQMYQISQMLREQKSVMHGILDNCSSNSKESEESTISDELLAKEKEKLAQQSAEEARKKLLGVLEKVEGASEIIEEGTNRTLIHEGDVLEIDPDNYSAVQRKRGYIFNDGIMLAVWVPNRRGPQRYKYQAFYNLESIGLVVNIRVPECPKFTFKLLIFPSVHLLQCPNQQEKDLWVNNIEKCQKILRNPSKHGGLSTKNSVESPTNERAPRLDEMGDGNKSQEESIGFPSLVQQLPDWILDLPEDLDVWIAQRNFTEAVSQYESFQEYFENQKGSVPLRDIKVKAESRIKTLIDTVVSDLEVMTPDKILQGGPRSIRKSIDFLCRLGRSYQASRLFLSHRSAFVRQRIKRLKSEGRSQVYLDRTAVIFFSSIIETIKEYKRLFTKNVGGAADLVVWVHNEVNAFMNNYCRQLFVAQIHLSSIAKSVGNLRSECHKLGDFGIDVTPIVDVTLIPHIERTVTSAKEKLIEAIKHRYRSQDEIGMPLRFSDNSSMERALNELIDLGVEDMNDYKQGDCALKVGMNSVAFAKTWLHFCEDTMLLYAAEWEQLINISICEILLAEMKQIEKYRKKCTSPGSAENIRVDALFILDAVCKAAHSMYTGTTGQELPELTAVVEEYTGRLKAKKAPVPLPRNNIPKTKYGSSEYL